MRKHRKVHIIEQIRVDNSHLSRNRYELISDFGLRVPKSFIKKKTANIV